MKRFKKILAYCPEPTSDERVLNWCRVIAERSEPEMVGLVRVLDHFLPEFPAEVSEEQYIELERESLSEEASQLLPEPEKKIQVLLGNPLHNILSELSDGSYDLVVVPVQDTQSRNFAERLARKSPVGVLIVPPDTEPFFEHILVPLDFSDVSEITLDWAQAFSDLSRGLPDLKALHIMQTPITPRATMAIDSGRLRNTIYTGAMDNLKNLIHRHTENEHFWTPAVTEHSLPGVQIVEEAKKHKADLIVIGAHGRGALSIALLGGAATEVIRTSDRPILVVKRKNESLGFLQKLLGFSK